MNWLRRRRLEAEKAVYQEQVEVCGEVGSQILADVCYHMESARTYSADSIVHLAKGEYEAADGKARLAKIHRELAGVASRFRDANTQVALNLYRNKVKIDELLDGRSK